jgi:phosphoglycerate dehydrogenase-like enzyme
VISERLRVHIENDPAAADALRLDQDRLGEALAGREELKGRIDVTFNDEPARFASVAADAEIIFAGRKLDDMASLPKLRWVQSVSAGVEAILPYLPPQVMLTNAGGVHGDKGAEFILASVLMLNYGIPRFATDQRHRRWQPDYGGTVRGKVATLLGIGAIGAPAARLLKSFGVRTQAVSRSGGERSDVDVSTSFAGMDSLLPQTDFLIASAPLTAETEGMMDRRRLDLLPRRAGIVIVGRAKVFDCEALVAKLREGSLAGAVLDVFPTEPLPANHPIWATPNLIMTPHCSVDDHSVYLDRCLGIFLDNLVRYLGGRPLRNLVDRSRGY